jgi:ABC-type transport system involved in multi-copper enzyme maturation permease subunit
MSEAAAIPVLPSGLPLWLRQLRAVLGLELKKSLLSRRAIPYYLLAGFPVALTALRAILALTNVLPPNDPSSHTTVAYAIIYQGFILRFVVFFGCVGIFMNLFRGEIIDRSLHFYFLVPLRRELVVAGKYLAGLLSTLLLFGGCTVLGYVLLYLRHGAGATLEHLTEQGGLGMMAGYLGITALACVGYGALFMTIGILFKNPVLAAGAILLWENVLFLLPPLLKKISVIYYLQSLCPVAIPKGPFELLAEPASAWVAVPGLLVVTAFLLLLAVWLIRRKEVRYESD